MRRGGVLNSLESLEALFLRFPVMMVMMIPVCMVSEAGLFTVSLRVQAGRTRVACRCACGVRPAPL